MKFVREPGKRCLPKWYIENINDYITLVLYIGLVFDSKNIQFHIICSFYYSISINSTEVDPHSNSLQWYSETQEYCEHDQDQESFQSSIHQFYLKNKNFLF